MTMKTRDEQSRSDHTKISTTSPLKPAETERIEAGVLAQTLRHPEKFFDPVKRLFRPEYFRSHLHRRIFAKIMEAGEHPALVLVQRVAHSGIFNLKERVYINGELFTNPDLYFMPVHLESVAREMQATYLQADLREHLIRRLKDSGDPETAKEAIREFEEARQGLADTSRIQNFDELLINTLDEIERAMKEGVEIRSPWPSLDHYLGGLYRGDVIIIGARTSMGKTALAANVLASVAEQRKRVLFYCIEQPPNQIMKRLISMRMGVENWKLREGSLSKEDWERIAKMTELDWRDYVFIPEVGRPNLEGIMNDVERFKPDVLIIDQIQLVSLPGEDRRAQELAQFTADIKASSVEKKIHTMICSQLNRQVESRGGQKIPTLADMKDSGGIEDFCDGALLLHWPHAYNAEKPRNDYNIFIAKNRHGPMGHIELNYEAKYFTFYEKDEQSPHADQRELI